MDKITASFVTRRLDSRTILRGGDLLDQIIREFQNIEAVEFLEDPQMLGYVMRVQLKDPDFRWITEDF